MRSELVTASQIAKLSWSLLTYLSKMAKRSQLNNDVRMAMLTELDAARRRQCKLTKMPRLRPTLKSTLRTIKCIITAPMVHPLRVRQCGSNLAAKHHAMKSRQDVARCAPETYGGSSRRLATRSTTFLKPILALPW